MAYVNTEEVVNEMTQLANPVEYSPVLTPEAEQVDSSSDSSSPSTPQTPNWSELSHEEAQSL
eukprot:6244858-Amphidinium_carterae.1